MRAVLFVFPLISLFGFISQEAQARGGQCGGFYGPPMYSSPAMYSGSARYYGPPCARRSCVQDERRSLVAG
jgi:hypothetical protein